MKIVDVAIIGSGPAGLFTALNIDKSANVYLFEKNDIPGRKLLMAGAGMCNFTHSGDIREFYDKYGDEKKFLRTAFSKCSNGDVINFFAERGLESEEDKNGKIFPVTRKSKDVLNILLEECRKKGVNFRYNESVIKITQEDGKFQIITSKGEYSFDKVVIATGGKSYPTTGSSGDGYKFAEMLGHTVINIRSALTAVTIKNYIFSEIAGLSFADKKIFLFRKEKKIKEWQGDILLTNKGVSGPGILDNSRYMENGDVIKVNFADTSEEKARDEFLNCVKNDGKQGVKRYLKNYGLSENMMKIIMEKSMLNMESKIAEVSKESRELLIKMITAHPFEIESIDGFNCAMATAGGVSLKEVNSKTMESKIKQGIYFTGEVLDIDGNTGGYNIQAAFSTGYLAAMDINSKLNGDEN